MNITLVVMNIIDEMTCEYVCVHVCVRDRSCSAVCLHSVRATNS